MSFTIETERKNQVLCVRLNGELDHHASGEARKVIDAELDQGDIQHLILNAEGLTFMDSSGIGVILGRYKKLQKKGGELVVCAVSPPVHRLFEMAGLFKILRLEQEEAQALQALGEAV